MLFGAAAYSWLIAAGMCILSAAWLARVGWQTPVVRHLVVFLLTVALFDVANGISLGGGASLIPWYVLAIATVLLPAAALGFYGAYIGQSGRRAWWVWAWPAAGFLALMTLLFPELWVVVRNGTVEFGPVTVLYGLNYLLFAALAFELTRDAIGEEKDAGKRRSMLWLALGFSFLPAYVATSDFFFIDVLKQQTAPGLFLTIAHYISVLAGVVLAALFVVLARAALRTKQEQQKVDVAWFLLALVAPGATVLIQMLFIAFDAFNPVMSVAVEGVWAMLFPLFISFAVARYSSFGMATDSRPGLRIILFALLFPLAFALGWMAGTNSYPDQPTWLIGLIFMGLLLPFVKILWGQTNVWASRILGMRGEEADDA